MLFPTHSRQGRTAVDCAGLGPSSLPAGAACHPAPIPRPTWGEPHAVGAAGDSPGRSLLVLLGANGLFCLRYFKLENTRSRAACSPSVRASSNAHAPLFFPRHAFDFLNRVVKLKTFVCSFTVGVDRTYYRTPWRPEDDWKSCSLLSPCGFRRLNSGCQAWWQAPLPAKPSHLSYLIFNLL